MMLRRSTGGALLVLVFLGFCIFPPDVAMFRAKSLKKRIVPGMSWSEVVREFERSQWSLISFAGTPQACGVISRTSAGGVSLYVRGRTADLPGKRIPLTGLLDVVVTQHAKGCSGLRVVFFHPLSLRTAEFQFSWDADGRITIVGEPRKED